METSWLDNPLNVNGVLAVSLFFILYFFLRLAAKAATRHSHHTTPPAPRWFSVFLAFCVTSIWIVVNQ